MTTDMTGDTDTLDSDRRTRSCSCRRRAGHPAVRIPRLGRGSRRPQAADPGDALARPRDRRRRFAGRAARDHGEARRLLGERIRLAQDARRGSTRCPTSSPRSTGSTSTSSTSARSIDNALPIIVTHGWPGSIVEQLKIIGPLTDPTAHGGTAADAFDVVIPSMPGYGFSARPTEAGWNPPRIVNAWITLMKRLGYTRFVAQGGDWGALITEIMGAIGAAGAGRDPHQHGLDRAARSLRRAARRQGPARGPRRRGDAGPTSGSSSSSPTASPMRTRWGSARRRFTGSRIRRSASPPGSSTTTSRATEMIARAFDGEAEGLTRDDVLDNITITWLTNTAISGARLYWEALPRTSPGFGIERNNVHFFEPIGVKVPIAVSASPTSSTRRREAGRNGPIPSSSTTTGSRRAGTSPPSSSRATWWTRCAPGSARSAER